MLFGSPLFAPELYPLASPLAAGTVTAKTHLALLNSWKTKTSHPQSYHRQRKDGDL